MRSRESGEEPLLRRGALVRHGAPGAALPAGITTVGCSAGSTTCASAPVSGSRRTGGGSVGIGATPAASGGVRRCADAASSVVAIALLLLPPCVLAPLGRTSATRSRGSRQSLLAVLISSASRVVRRRPPRSSVQGPSRAARSRRRTPSPAG